MSDHYEIIIGDLRDEIKEMVSKEKLLDLLNNMQDDINLGGVKILIREFFRDEKNS